MSECICRAASEKRFDCVENAVYQAHEVGPILAGCEKAGEAREKWMTAWRCRSCGTVWVEAWAMSGQMDIQHFYPCPAAGEDPEGWLRREGKSVPLRAVR